MYRFSNPLVLQIALVLLLVLLFVLAGGAPSGFGRG